MQQDRTIKKLLLSIKLEETIPVEYHYQLGGYLSLAYQAGWDAGYQEINQHGNKPIGQFDKQKKLINVYKSLKEAARVSGFSEKGIRRCMIRGTPMKQGWIWEYLPKPNN